jgi:hypothetical protein
MATTSGYNTVLPDGDKYSLSVTNNNTPAQQALMDKYATAAANIGNKMQNTPYTQAAYTPPTSAQTAVSVSNLEKTYGMSPTQASSLESSVTGPNSFAVQNNANAGKSNLVALDPQIVADLNSNNFAGAYQLAGNQLPAPLSGNSQTAYSQLNSASGLQSLDPSKVWTPAEVNQYYAAAMNPATRQAYAGTTLLGGESPIQNTNPDMVWGGDTPSDISADAARNIAAGGAPNIGQYTGMSTADGTVMGKIAAASPQLALAAISAMTGGAASAAIGGLGGATAGGAIAGGISTTGNDLIQNKPITLGGEAKGVGIGALTGAVGYEAAPVANSLSNGTGLNPILSSGLVKGTVGAGVGALGSTLAGGKASDGALVGGIGGVASGLVGGASGNNQVGNASGTIAGALASKYLTSPAAPAAPAPVAAPAAAPPLKATVGQQIKPAPVVAPTPATGTPAANIGAYSGFGGAAGSGTTGLGYAPYKQTGPVANPYTYAQGPEQAMFTSANGPA